MRKGISNPIKQMKKLSLSLSCMFKVTQQARSEARSNPEVKCSHYTSPIRYRQLFGLVFDRITWYQPTGVGSRKWCIMAKRDEKGKELETPLQVQIIHSDSFLWLSNTLPNPIHMTLSTPQFPLILVAPTGPGKDMPSTRWEDPKEPLSAGQGFTPWICCYTSSYSR